MWRRFTSNCSSYSVEHTHISKHTHTCAHARAWSESKGWFLERSGEEETAGHFGTFRRSARAITPRQKQTVWLLSVSTWYTRQQNHCCSLSALHVVPIVSEDKLPPTETNKAVWCHYEWKMGLLLPDLPALRFRAWSDSCSHWLHRSASDTVLITQGDQKVHCTLIIWQTKHWQRREKDDGTMKENVLVNGLQYEDWEGNDRFSRASTVI